MTRFEAASGAKANAHRRVEMGAGAIAKGIDHREHDQAEGERNTRVRDRARRHLVNDDSPGSGENEEEGPEEF